MVACASAAFAQDELKSWVSTNWGDTRIYQHESGNKRWKTEETIEKPVTVPEGTIVIRRIRTFDGKPLNPEPKERAWLIRGDCLYELTPADWDPRHRGELSGAPAGGICFPLTGGRVTVTERDPSSLDNGRTYHISSNAEDLWFERGAGIVKEDDVRNGEQTHSQLLYFGPAPARPQGTLPAPMGEVGVEYSYNSLSSSNNGESNQNGGMAYGHYFFPKTGGGAGIVAEFSGSGSNGGSLYTFLAGPSLMHEWRRAHLVYQIDLLAGGAHVRQVSLAQGTFVIGAAYALQYRASDHYVVTLFRVEPLSLEVPDLASGRGHWQSDFRVTAGIGFRFGEK